MLRVIRNRELAVQNGLVLQTEQVCRRCHNEESPTYRPFDYDERARAIAHPTPRG